MRLEATIPDPLAEAADSIAEQLGLTRSQLVQEAVGLYLKAVMEVRNGRRLAVSSRAAERLAAFAAKAAAPTAAFKRAVRRRR